MHTHTHVLFGLRLSGGFCVTHFFAFRRALFFPHLCHTVSLIHFVLLVIDEFFMTNMQKNLLPNCWPKKIFPYKRVCGCGNARIWYINVFFINNVLNQFYRMFKTIFTPKWMSIFTLMNNAIRYTNLNLFRCVCVCVYIYYCCKIQASLYSIHVLCCVGLTGISSHRIV